MNSDPPERDATTLPQKYLNCFAKTLPRFLKKPSARLTETIRGGDYIKKQSKNINSELTELRVKGLNIMNNYTPTNWLTETATS